VLVAYDLPGPVWVFYALGPQLALCLLLGYLAARRRRASVLDWLAGAFLASLAPVFGVTAMLYLWWSSPKAPGAGGDAAP